VKHVKFHLNRFLRRVRIHGGEFDTSARAMYREGVTSSLRADLRIVRRSTIERKQMSTKTTFKRIALVTVAALGFGVMSVAPSSAATNVNLWVKVADGVSAGTASTAGNDVGGGIAGAYNNVTLGFTQFGAGDVVELTGGTFVSSTDGTLNTAKTAVVSSSASNASLVVATPVVGVITAKLYKNTAGVVSATASETVSITVAATGSSQVYSAAKSSAYIVAGETYTATADAATAITAAKTVVADTATASIVVQYLDGLGKPVVGDTLTATITSGPGTIATRSSNSGTRGPGYSYDSSTAISGVGGNVGNAAALTTVANQYSIGTPVETYTGIAAFHIFSNNLPGVTTVTIKNVAGEMLWQQSHLHSPIQQLLQSKQLF